MAQAKPKKKRRSRSDPARREAAARREEVRHRAAEERRRSEEAAARRKKIRQTARRVGVPAVIGIGVVAAALFLFRPQREVTGAEMVPTATIVADLGYELPEDIDTGALPDPVCGVLDQAVSSGPLVYSDLLNGAVILWHAEGDEAAAEALARLAGEFDSHVVVSPSPQVTGGVLATSWDRRKAHETADEDLHEFVEVYRGQAPQDGACDPPG
jgi:hypothetical protein